MEIRKYFRMAIILIALVAAFAASGCGAGQQAPAAKTANADGGLVVKILDVGQGDSILIRSGGQVTLIDTGDIAAREKLTEYIKKEGITVIDQLILTHPHNDHIGGVAAIFDNFTVKQIYDSGQTTTTATFRKYLETVEKKKIPFALLAADGQVDLGQGAMLKILAPTKPFFTEDNGGLDLNNNAIVAKLVYGSFAMLLASDAEKQSEEQMMKKYGAELKSNVIKVGHHGSNTSSSTAFLKAVAPEAAVITVGANNDYHHPHPAIVKRYEERKTKVYRTDLNGTITIGSDGKTWTIGKEKG